MNETTTQVHATCVAMAAGGGWLGLLLRGPSGVGKSGLALCLIDGGAQLVADDRVDLQARDGKILAGPPSALAGRIEVRGLGILPVSHQTDVVLGMVVDLVVEGGDIPRLPAVRTTNLLGLSLPWMQLHPFEASAAAKLRLAVRALPWNDMGIMSAGKSKP